MSEKDCILSIDQSTSGTKAMIFNSTGRLLGRSDREHDQIIDRNGWVEHDPLEIYRNTLLAVREVLNKTGVERDRIAAAGISNQRETGAAWDKNGNPLHNAIVWQCPRGEKICAEIAATGAADIVKHMTGLTLSPFFTAAKWAWLLRNSPAVISARESGELMLGTMDSWLIYKLCGVHKTDYSNASRTQLFNIHSLAWDQKLCKLFDIPQSALPEVCYSDSLFGESDFEGIFESPIPVCGVLGDSHAALLAQGCIEKGMAKATYGTGSSVMLNTGDAVRSSTLVTSLAWGLEGKVAYVLEGNINYTGAVIKWLQNEMGLISSPQEAEECALSITDTGGVYLVPAFTGLGAPHWDSEARAAIIGMGRGTGKEQIARAAEEAIAYQIRDVLEAVPPSERLNTLRVDGGPTRDKFLMQFQSDILGIPLEVSGTQELSGAGAGFAAGLSIGLYTWDTLGKMRTAQVYYPQMNRDNATALYGGWRTAVKRVRYSDNI